MKRFITQALLLAGGVTLLNQAAQANPDDLVLGFTLGTANNDYIIDLGPGSTIGVGGSSTLNLSGDGFSAASLTSSSGFGANLSGVTMGVVGGKATGLPGQDLWLTQVRSGAGNPALPGSSLQGASITGGPGNGSPFANGILNGTALTAGNGTLWPRTDPSSFSTEIYGSPSFVTQVGINPGGTIGSGPLYEDLYQEVDAAGARGSLSGHWTYQGFFTFDPTADTLTFTPATVAVPEPSTYGLIAGAGLLIVALRRQFTSKSI